MKYVKTFELFGFGKKKKQPDDPQTWKIRLEWILENYLKKSKYQSLDADYRNGTYMVSYSNKYGFHHISIIKDEKDNVYRVSYNASGQIDNWPIISEDEYEKYRKGIMEISDYLDEKENISRSSVDDFLNMSSDESDFLKAKGNVYSKLTNFLKGFIGSDIEFEAIYHLWSNKSENQKIVENIKVKIVDLDQDSLDYIGNGIIKFKCEWKGFNLIMTITENTIEEYVDLSEIKPWDKTNLIKLSHDESNLSRKEKRKESTYPHFIWMDLSPSEYKSIEFIKACKEIIEFAKN